MSSYLVCHHQNQRQKARRPRSQSGAPPTRPQQYTNLPTSLPNAERYDTARSDQGPSTVRFHTAFSHSPYDTQYRSDEHSYGRHLFPEAYRGPAHSSPLTQLLGPGMPGVDYRTSPSFRAQIIPARSPHSFTDRPPPAPRLHSQSPISMQRPTTSHASGRRHRQELSTTLPPLLFDSSQQRDCSPALGPSSMRSQFPHSAAHSTSDPHPSTPLESPFALRLSEPPSRQSMPIPPPFTLRSRWDFPFLPSSFSSRLETASWTRTNPSPSPRDTLSSAIGCEHPPPDQEELHRLAAPSRSDSVRQQETTSRPEYSPPMRSGRYDPVRAAVIPYEGTTSITTSPSSPPLQSTGENVTHSDDKHSYERRHCSPPGSN